MHTDSIVRHVYVAMCNQSRRGLATQRGLSTLLGISIHLKKN